MPNVYSRTTKIHDAVGRSMYISGATGKQEEVVLHERHMLHDWQFIREFEKTHQHNPGQHQNEGRELVIALPNDLASSEKYMTSHAQKVKLANICNDLASSIIGPDHDYEFCVHWNDSRTNLHVHILFCERQNISVEPCRYKKDIWQDPTTGRLAKANSDNAILVHHKGDIQYTKDGQIKYKLDPLSAKDRKFKAHSFMAIRDRHIQRVLDSYGYHLDIQDKSSPYLSQRKLYKYANEDYRQAASDYNKAVRSYNAAVKEHISLEPEQLDHYKEIRFEIETEVREANRVEHLISQRAIDTVVEMAKKVREFVRELSNKISESVNEWWATNRDRILSVFQNQVSNTMEVNYESERGRSPDLNKSAKHDDQRAAIQNKHAATKSVRERIAALRSSDNRGEFEESSEHFDRSADRKRSIKTTSPGIKI